MKNVKAGFSYITIISLMALTSSTGCSDTSSSASLPEAHIDNTVVPFKINIPDADLNELRQRIAATRWPDKETVADRSQGVQLERFKTLVNYWGTAYDWRKIESKLNALPQFKTNIDGLDIHFIHVRSKHKNALPLIVTHGWPGSVIEQLKIIGPLTDPTAYGGKEEDAFDVVIPSMPGYGFSGKPENSGWGPDRIAKAWDVLMKRLGYTEYVAQGGDWGAVICDAMGRQAPKGLLGIHVNMPATVPADIAKALKNGDPAPEGLSEEEKKAYESMNDLYTKGGAYAGIMVTRPQTLGYSLADSPSGLAAFYYDKFNDWTFSGGDAEKSLSKHDMLDDITLYWLTNTGTSSAQLYWENNNNNFNVVEQRTAEISVPVAVTVFPGEIYQAPKTWTEQAYKTLIYYNKVDKGGHFAAWEEPQLFTQELRAAFRPLRK
ncbi:epoxide hydrolase family protein [Parafilimonas terrae]|jgi:pimeloyl-ACP methyl ester carboxylesterase|uniref:Pimeloyl-ACP methyl ester carboxylesterase n=1 Tax=Parafilimonas terrae TaxID=1465490 RepID=A0A1I5Y248_9BACT|nr:epoxide hydrolase family protein [Parafilimonas terrae]SFQ38057.1 Pimeloyl-ACP methyl ester carboxylesterase [Parafilimonas terrae]